MRPSGWTFGIASYIGGLAGLLFAAAGLAGEPAAATGPLAVGTVRANTAAPASQDASPVLSGFLEQVLRDQFREPYVDDDDWGKTRRVTVQEITGKPFQWKLETREKVVNDGLWEKYSVWLADPDEHLDVHITHLEWHDNKVLFTLSASARLEGDARLERWRQGVKMLNTHLEARATVGIVLTGEVAFRLTSGNGSLPAVAIEPTIADLDIRLKKLKLKRISKLDGSLVHELGDGLKDTIQHELNRREPKVVGRLNKSIGKHKDQLVLSAEQFAKAGWSKLQHNLEGK